MGFYRVLPSSSRIILLSFRDCGSGTGEEPFLFCLMMGWDDIQRWFFFFCQKGITGFFLFCLFAATHCDGGKDVDEEGAPLLVALDWGVRLSIKVNRVNVCAVASPSDAPNEKETEKEMQRKRKGSSAATARPIFHWHFTVPSAILFFCISGDPFFLQQQQLSSSRGQVAATSMARSLLVAKK